MKGVQNEITIGQNNQKDNISIMLRKIQHKPLIMSLIYSYAQKRPYILLHLISSDNVLKESLKNTFNSVKKNNNLPKEIITNIKNYITYRKIRDKLSEKLKEIEIKIFNKNKELNIIDEKLKTNDIFNSINDREEFINTIFKDNEDLIDNLIDKNYSKTKIKLLELYYSNYSKIFDKEHSYYNKLPNKVKPFFTIDTHIYQSKFLTDYKTLIPKKNNGQFFNDIIKRDIAKIKYILKDVTKDILNSLSYYDFVTSESSVIRAYFKLLNKEQKILFIDLVYYFYYYENPILLKTLNVIDFNRFSLSTKKLRESYQKNIDNDDIKINNLLSLNNFEYSVSSEIINNSEFENFNKDDLINFSFDYFSSLDNFFIYNLQKEKKNINNESNNKNDLTDDIFLRYIENNGNNKKICLICILGKYQNYINIDSIVYKNVNELYFTLLTKNNLHLNELNLFNDINFEEIYSMFIKCFCDIKNKNNIEKISFGDEFIISKNQYFLCSTKYYQSIISFLIDKFLINYFETKKNTDNTDIILSKMNIKNINLNLDKLDNIYEKYKIIYGFNKMFPSIENKKLLELSFNDILEDNSNQTNNKKFENDYKIIIINFNEVVIKDDINIIFEKIKNYIIKNYSTYLTNVEIISFTNFIIENNNKNNIINNSHFNDFKNLKEFFINNYSGKKIGNIFNLKITKKFEFIYTGYDLNDKLIYYRNGINGIKSADLLDLFNIYNNNIIKLCLKYENINIILKDDKTELKIIDLENCDKSKISNKHHIFSIKNLSDFIFNLNNLNGLMIHGFDFTFDEIKNKNIKKLSINYDINNDKCFHYNNKKFADNLILIKKDINIKLKFPELKEISIGNIINEDLLYNKLFITENFSNNLTTINIISNHSFKANNIDTNKIKINVISRKDINEKNNKFIEGDIKSKNKKHILNKSKEKLNLRTKNQKYNNKKEDYEEDEEYLEDYENEEYVDEYDDDTDYNVYSRLCKKKK